MNTLTNYPYIARECISIEKNTLTVLFVKPDCGFILEDTRNHYCFMQYAEDWIEHAFVRIDKELDSKTLATKREN